LIFDILNSSILLGIFYLNTVVWNSLHWVFNILEREIFILPHIKILEDFSKKIYKHFDVSKLSQEVGNLFLYTYFSKKVEIWLYEKEEKKFKLKADIGFLPSSKQNQIEISDEIVEKIGEFKYQLIFRCLLRIYPAEFLRKHSYIIEIMNKLNAHFLLIIKNTKKVYGFLTARDVSNYMEFLKEDYNMLSYIGEEIADIVDNMEKYISVRESKLIQRDWVIAEEIQKSLLPNTIPEFNDFRVAVYFSTVKGIGGDYYDVFKVGDNELGVLLNDVAGKGLPAALVMSVIRSIVHASLEYARQPKRLLTLVNSTIYGQVSLDRYSTEYYFIYDKENNEIRYSNAGHIPMMIYQSQKDEFIKCDTQGIPIGIMPNVEYDQNVYNPFDEDIGILYTDGLNEALNKNREQFGEDRIKACIRESKELSPNEILRILCAKLEDFTAGAEQHDDTTIIIWKKCSIQTQKQEENNERI